MQFNNGIRLSVSSNVKSVKELNSTDEGCFQRGSIRAVSPRVQLSYKPWKMPCIPTTNPNTDTCCADEGLTFSMIHHAKKMLAAKILKASICCSNKVSKRETLSTSQEYGLWLEERTCKLGSLASPCLLWPQSLQLCTWHPEKGSSYTWFQGCNAKLNSKAFVKH